VDTENIWRNVSDGTKLKGKIMDCDLMKKRCINPLNAKLNPICPFLALFGAHHILHVSK